jgi:hypothetical protein
MADQSPSQVGIFISQRVVPNLANRRIMEALYIHWTGIIFWSVVPMHVPATEQHKLPLPTLWLGQKIKYILPLQHDYSHTTQQATISQCWKYSIWSSVKNAFD